MKRKHLLLLALLVIAVLLLAGCGVPPEGVSDLNALAPSGPWQTFVVWPLAKSLVWLNNILLGWGVPYHWGFAIILFTFLVKLITAPLTIMQIRGMNAQKALQPRIAELQKKYGSDRNRIAQEQMKLYQEAGVNPLSGCLPLIIQMPILFGLYAALVAIGPYLLNSSFFWIPDLAFPTALHGMGWITEAFQTGTATFNETGISGYATLAAYLVLPILLMVTQFIMQKYMTPTAPGADSQVKTTQQITLVMTFMFGFFTLQVPAGLTLYWVTSNLLQMGQTWFMMRTPAPAAPVTIDGTATPVVDSPVNAKALPDKKSEKSAAKPAAKPKLEKATTVKATSSKSASASNSASAAPANTTTLNTTIRTTNNKTSASD